MNSEHDKVQLQRVAKGKKPLYSQDPATDKLLSMVLVLTQELSVALDRIDTLERVLSEDKPVLQGRLDDFEVTEAVAAQRSDMRDALLHRLFRACDSEFQAMVNFPPA